MIHCKKCKTINPETVSTCQNCDEDLLTQFKPMNDSMVIALYGLLGGMILFVIVGGINWLIAGRFQLIFPAIAFIVGFGLMAAFLKNVRGEIRSNPYFKRAVYHVERDPRQAISDYKKVLETLPFTIAETATRKNIQLALVGLYDQLGLEEELDNAVDATINHMNTLINSTSKTEPWLLEMFIKEREAFCEEHHTSSKLSNLKSAGRCISCNKVLESRVFSFHYGKLVDSKSMPFVIPYVAGGIATNKGYHIQGELHCNICFLCYAGTDFEKGSKKAIELKKAELKQKGYNAFFTPKEYKELRTQK